MAELLALGGLAAGNFIFQAGGGQDWGTAIERTFFQAVAILVVWLIKPS